MIPQVTTGGAYCENYPQTYSCASSVSVTTCNLNWKIFFDWPFAASGHKILTVGAATSLFLTKGFIESSTVMLLGGDVGKSVMLWWDVVRSSGSTGWHVMSFTRNRCPDARDECPMLRTCENFVWSANVSCHKFKVPLECFDTIDRAGEGSADITSDKLPPFPESSPVELAEPVTWKTECQATFRLMLSDLLWRPKYVLYYSELRKFLKIDNSLKQDAEN